MLCNDFEVTFRLIHPAPVGFPDVQDVRVGDLHVFSLSVQEVEEVLNGEWGFVLLHSPNTSEQVFHKRVHCHLRLAEKCTRFRGLVVRKWLGW